MTALGLHHAALASADLEGQVAYYEEVIGLHATMRVAGRVHLASRSGADALVLSAATQTGLTGLGLRIAADTDLTHLCRNLGTHGVQAEIATDSHPGVTRSVAFTDPEGLRIELIAEDRIHAAAPSRGVAVLRLGHVAACVTDLPRAVAFYGDVFGLRISDWIGTHFAFMRCGHEHHTLNFVQSDRARMQHIAFEMQNAAALTQSCDVLAEAGLNLLWGPVRHGPGHNIATYHANTAGQIIELFAEMDVMSNEALGYYDPRPWHADRPQRPKVWAPRPPQSWGAMGPPDFLKLGV